MVLMVLFLSVGWPAAGRRPESLRVVGWSWGGLVRLVVLAVVDVVLVGPAAEGALLARLSSTVGGSAACSVQGAPHQAAALP
jgi:hypothetical protein